MSISQRLPHTEGIVPIRHNTEKLRVLDKHPALIESERVLRLLYNTVSCYDRDYPGMLSVEARNAVLALRAALVHHNLAEQSVRLQIAVDELHKCCVGVTAHVNVYGAIAEVERFLGVPETRNL